METKTYYCVNFARVELCACRCDVFDVPHLTRFQLGVEGVMVRGSEITNVGDDQQDSHTNKPISSLTSLILYWMLSTRRRYVRRRHAAMASTSGDTKMRTVHPPPTASSCTQIIP